MVLKHFKPYASNLELKLLRVAAVALLLSNYISAAGLAVRLPAAFHVRFMIAAHTVLAALLLRAWRAVHVAG